MKYGFNFFTFRKLQQVLGFSSEAQALCWYKRPDGIICLAKAEGLLDQVVLLTNELDQVRIRQHMFAIYIWFHLKRLVSGLWF